MTIVEKTCREVTQEVFQELKQKGKPFIRKRDGQMSAGFFVNGEWKEVMEIHSEKDIDTFVSVFDLSFVTISNK